ncbi:hypothetical protein A3L09_10385 [Thermococcus profundus]|uniref:UPF0216 protein A3L09_10385 n=1 Tax=Thermococcus profundus TaxID=49899 RepID=A0A2Z2MFY8_THEPR|nr:DUF61 family protein [Thermococcus profundus]ASJ03635.1 hypothetical protein A3L09_10385 [Thermococcus profundus]
MPTAEDVLKREIFRINLHLPRERVSLSELLGMDDPSVLLRDGSRHYFKRSELQYLASLLDPGEADRLRLPIVLEISTVDRGYFRVRGRLAVKVVDKIFEQFDPLNEREEGRYPRYLLPRIRRILPTATTYAFISE